MAILPHIEANERLRVALLAFLLFINAIVVQSNGVVATSGFIANVGTAQILLVWALDNAIIFSVSGAYSLFVDRMKRSRLALILFSAAAVVYGLMFLLFRAGAPDALTYTLLIFLNDQQWILFALAVWALANDVFSVSEAKRLFPILGLAGLAGGIAGNGMAAALARSVTIGNAGFVPAGFDLAAPVPPSPNASLMLLNTVLMAVAAGGLWLALRRIRVIAHQARAQGGLIEVAREGISFVRDVPAFRYLALAMLLVGIGLNTIEYQLIVSAAATFPNEADLSAFYGTFRMFRMLSLLVMHILLAGWVLRHISFKSVFTILPSLMFLALFLPIWLPGLLIVAAGEYVIRVVMEGVDDPARRAFIGMVPDEQRGRVSAFFDGYLYPIGAVISCLLIGLALILEHAGLIPMGMGQPVYLALVAGVVGVSLYFVLQLRATYDKSLLSWRLRRRKRSTLLTDLDL